MKTNKRNLLTLLALLLATVFSVGGAEATEGIDLVRIVPYGVSPEDHSWTSSIQQLVILHPVGEITIPDCGSIDAFTDVGWRCVVLDGDDTHLVDVVPMAGAALSSGQRFTEVTADGVECCLDEDMNIVPCGSSAIYSIRRAHVVSAQSTTSDLLLFESPEPITADHVGVVTGPQDEFGFADVVFSTKGEKPINSVLLTPDYVEQGDKISDVILLDYDEETGIALYGATVEY